MQESPLSAPFLCYNGAKPEKQTPVNALVNAYKLM